MHNDYYASGFLFHPPSGKILLQQSPENKNTPVWSLFTGRYDSRVTHVSFCNVISEQLAVEIKEDAVFPVYDYVRSDAKEFHFIFYAVVSREDLVLKPREGYEVRWFTAKEILKLKLAQQDRHDITIGLRVIGAALRDQEIAEAGASLDER